jgi:hypothetical protein
MRAVIVAVLLAGVFIAGLLVSDTTRVSADTHTPPKQGQWQYQCFEATGVAQVTEQSNKMGEQGWELVTSAGTGSSTLWCFKRPLWKKPK